MATTSFNYNAHEIVLRSTHVGEERPWDGKHWKQSFNVNVKVTNLEDGDINVTNFRFYQPNKILLKNDLLHAFWCFVSDAQSATMDIDDFSSEFGYTKISECLKIHRECQRQLEKYQTLRIPGDICDLLNWLTETYNI